MPKLILQNEADVQVIELVENTSTGALDIAVFKEDGVTPASALNVIASIVVNGGQTQLQRGSTDVPGIAVDPAVAQHIASPTV